MKRNLTLGLGALALALALPFAAETPVLANLLETGQALAQNILQPRVQLNLSAAKQVIELDVNGEEKITWLDMGDKAAVVPGDVLKYELTSENDGEKPAGNLVVTQPVPNQTHYVLESAKANGAELTFSIDGGETFVAEPLVEVTLPDGTVELQPAPAEAYTHIRWDYGQSLEPLASVKAVYEVSVQ